MIINKPEYRLNKNGTLVLHQTVTIKCDLCGTEWDTLYAYRIRKKYEKDLCSDCRAKNRFPNGKIDKPSILVNCAYCGKEVRKFASSLSKTVFCNKICEAEASQIKYNHLYETFEQNPNELAYLCGLILGDGHLHKGQKYTTPITIAFDIKYPELMEYTVFVLDKLQVIYSFAPTTQSNCQMLNLTLPDKLLEKYGMLWSGNKFDAQPIPIDSIINNINFVGGLINSDGSVCTQYQGERPYFVVNFVNTCKSIIECYTHCLSQHNIHFGTYTYDPTPHPLTGNMQKRSWTVKITQQKEIERIYELLPMLKKRKLKN
jgi:hypothetical protein